MTGSGWAVGRGGASTRGPAIRRLESCATKTTVGLPPAP